MPPSSNAGRSFKVFFSIVSLAAAAWCENGLTHQERKDGFESLFDGKTLAGWHSIRLDPAAGSWRARKGLLTWNKGGSWLATDETYYDFVLRLEYRTGPGSVSGIFLRSGPEGNPAFSGLKIPISSDAGKNPDVRSTAALYGAAAPLANPAKPEGEWNQVEITLVKRALSAVWNGRTVLDVNLDDPRYASAEGGPLSARLPYGHIGLQASPGGAPVEFRNIRILTLKVGTHFK